MSMTALLLDAPKTLRKASAASNDEALAGELDRLATALETTKTLTVSEAAEMLGVSSPNTVKNWLKVGSFPGAFKTPGGHFRFPLDEVLAVKAEMERIRDLNKSGTLAVPDAGDEPEFPL